MYERQPKNVSELGDLGLDLSAFTDGLPGGFFIYEAHGEERILYANRQMASIFACEDVDDFMSHVGGTFPGLVYHEDRMRIENSIWEQIDAGEAGDPTVRDQVTYRIVDKGGHIHYIAEYGRLVEGTSQGDLFFVFVAEVSTSVDEVSLEIKRAHEHVSVDVDSLTGLPSMRYYHAHTTERLARAAVEGKEMVDIFLDVDHFRTVNFRLGYEGGDEVLVRIAAILRDCFEDALIARFSDDHFVLVCERAGVEERIRAVHARVRRMVAGMSIEIKAGIFCLEPNVTSIPFAHDRAKAACSSIKGRYDVFFRYFDETLARSEDTRDYVLNHLEQAIAEGWIRNYYQPVVRVSTGECCGMEALSRWIDPDRGYLSPAQYVHVLEEARLVHLLDASVIAQACSDIKRCVRRIGVAIPVSLNFSPSALSLLDVPTLLEQNAREFDIAPELLHVEITESSLTEDPELLRSVIRRLHKRGFEVWMDDFGSGYSSLNLLKDYDFDVLKIDMEFLRGMEGSAKSRTIVRTISDLSHSLGMSTLVEGVETEGQLDFLRKVGADRAQGFLFSEPVPLEAILGDFLLRYLPEQRG